ncbi:MAG: superoxide dismutase, Ni [Dehalococcoidia bacterium]
MFTRTLFGLVNRLLPAREAHAHCDIPCGIYDPIFAKIAAQTVLKMVVRIQALPKPDPNNNDAVLAYHNSLARYIAVKEQHAEICKKELDILWHDYFRPEHLQKYPDLHNTFWTTLKLASKCKQSVDRKAAEDLVAAVDRIAEIFWATKGVQYSDPVAQVRFGT